MGLVIEIIDGGVNVENTDAIVVATHAVGTTSLLFTNDRIRSQSKINGKIEINVVGDVDSIDDNRTGGAGSIAVPGTMRALFDVLNPFFFSLAGVNDTPFFEQDGSINSGAFGGSGFVQASGSFTDAVGFNSIVPDEDASIFAQALKLGAGGTGYEPGIRRKENGFELAFNAFSNEDFVLDLSNAFLTTGWIFVSTNNIQVGAGDRGGVFGFGDSIQCHKDGFIKFFDANESHTAFFDVGTFTTANTSGHIAAIVAQNTTINSTTFRNAAYIGSGSTATAIDLNDCLHSDQFRSHLGDLEALTIGKGLVAKSPDGTRFRLTPPNGGGAASWVAA